jgi:hypothetical protein
MGRGLRPGPIISRGGFEKFACLAFDIDSRVLPDDAARVSRKGPPC